MTAAVPHTAQDRSRRAALCARLIQRCRTLREIVPVGSGPSLASAYTVTYAYASSETKNAVRNIVTWLKLNR